MSEKNAPDAALAARVGAFITDYCHALDDAHWDDWPEFFTEAGVYRIVTRDNHEAGLALGIMFCDGRGMMQDRMLALQTANVYEPHTYCHILGRSRLQFAGQTLSGRTNFHVIRTMQSGAMESFAAGKYLDTYDIQTDQIRLRERIVVLESRRVDILLVAPL